MNKKSIRSDESYALEQNKNNQFSFLLFSFYYILPFGYLLTSFALFIYRYSQLDIPFNKQIIYMCGTLIIIAAALGLLFYGRNVFTRRQLIKRVNLMNTIIFCLFMLSGLSIIIMFSANESTPQNPFLLLLLFSLMTPFLFSSVVFFLTTSLSYMVLIGLSPRFFKTPQNDSHLKRHTLIFYLVFLFIFYSSFLLLFIVPDKTFFA